MIRRTDIILCVFVFPIGQKKINFLLKGLNNVRERIMANGSLITFISISLVIIAAALYVGIASIKSKKSELKWIAMSACFGIFSVVFYFGRIFAETRRSYMTLSSLCFIGVLMSMYFFMRFVNVYTHMAELRWNRLLLRAILVAVISASLVSAQKGLSVGLGGVNRAWAL